MGQESGGHDINSHTHTAIGRTKNTCTEQAGLYPLWLHRVESLEVGRRASVCVSHCRAQPRRQRSVLRVALLARSWGQADQAGQPLGAAVKRGRSLILFLVKTGGDV